MSDVNGWSEHIVLIVLQISFITICYLNNAGVLQYKWCNYSLMIRETDSGSNVTYYIYLEFVHVSGKGFCTLESVIQ